MSKLKIAFSGAVKEVFKKNNLIATGIGSGLLGAFSIATGGTGIPLALIAIGSFTFLHGVDGAYIALNAPKPGNN